MRKIILIMPVSVDDFTKEPEVSMVDRLHPLQSPIGDANRPTPGAAPTRA